MNLDSEKTKAATLKLIMKFLITSVIKPSGVGGIEAEAVMLGQPISMVLPEVVGYKLSGKPCKFITSTDIVLTVTKVISIFLLARTIYQ